MLLSGAPLHKKHPKGDFDLTPEQSTMRRNDCIRPIRFPTIRFPRGSELSPLKPPKTPIPETERTREDTLDVTKPPAAPVGGRTEQLPSDPDLTEIITAWPELPEHVKAAIRTLVQSVPLQD